MRASTFTFLLALLTVGLSQADDSGWPRVVETGEGRITIYQPQVESLTDTRLEARAALAVHMEETDDPVFGAAWYQARIVTDRDERLVYVEDVTVPMVRFPDASEEQKEKLARFLERQIPASNLTLSLDQLLAGLDLEGNGVQGLKSDAPVILFSGAVCTEAAREPWVRLQCSAQ